MHLHTVQMIVGCSIALLTIFGVIITQRIANNQDQQQSKQFSESIARFEQLQATQKESELNRNTQFITSLEKLDNLQSQMSGAEEMRKREFETSIRTINGILTKLEERNRVSLREYDVRLANSANQIFDLGTPYTGVLSNEPTSENIEILRKSVLETLKFLEMEQSNPILTSNPLLRFQWEQMIKKMRGYRFSASGGYNRLDDNYSVYVSELASLFAKFQGNLNSIGYNEDGTFRRPDIKDPYFKDLLLEYD